jgi:pyridoxal phosphate enzyme (YggS family)
MIKEFNTLAAELADTGVTLVAISKKKPVTAIQELYEAGQRDFGENRVSELVDKQAQLPQDIRWHFVGHLQSKKTKKIAPFVHLIQSVDSEKLLEEIDKQADRSERRIDVLLQFKIAAEESKYGFDWEDGLAAARRSLSLPHVRVTGVMGMATFTDDSEQVRGEFRKLRTYFERLRSEVFSEDPAFREISMGMSGDYPLAVAEGSTMVRIGSLLFGPRD